MPSIFGAPGITPTLRGQPSNVWTLQPGNTRLIPSGTWSIQSTSLRYVNVQEYDPITTTWKAVGWNQGYVYLQSDGINYRLVNQTGCVVGAYLTNVGATYPANTTATVSGTSAAVLLPIVKVAAHLVNTTPTVSNGGTGYVYPPIVAFDAPPSPGIQATGYATINSSGVVTSITVTNQGGGYTATPNIYLVNDPRDTAGSGATATASLTGAGTLAAILVTDFGNPVSVVPTVTITGTGGTSAAATPLMAYVVSSYTVTSAGSGYSGNVLVTGLQPPIVGSNTNPVVQDNLVQWRQLWIGASLNAGSSSLTATGQIVYDGGLFASIPTGYVMGYASGSAAQVTFTGSGKVDSVYILPV